MKTFLKVGFQLNIDFITFLSYLLKTVAPKFSYLINQYVEDYLNVLFMY